MFTLFYMNLIVGISAALLTYRILKVSDLIDSFIAVFVLYFAQIVITEMILGLTGRLYLNNLIFLNLTVFLIIWSISKKEKSTLDLPRIKAAIQILNIKPILFIFSLILGFGIVKFWVNLVNPPFGWDSLNYHYTFAVEWLKHGNLDIPITISDDPFPTFYPINGSLYYLWLILPLKNVFIADLGQFPFFILAFFCVFNISKRIGLCKEYSFFAAALFSLIPNYFKQLEIAYVDLMVAGLFFASLNYILALREDFSLKNALLYGIAMGLLIGTKTIALPYSLLLFIPYLYLQFKNLNKSQLLFMTMFFMVIFGGFTYIRNAISYMNPLYPLDVSLFGKTIFRGVMDRSVYGIHFNKEDYSVLKLLFHEGLGGQTLIFILPAIFLTLPILLVKNKKKVDLFTTYFIFLPVLLFLIYRFIIPLANTRYIYPLLGVGMILAFYALNLLKVPKIYVYILAVLFSFASSFELAKVPLEIAVSLSLALAIFFFSGKIIKFIKIIVKNPIAVTIGLFSLILIFNLLNKEYILSEFSRYSKTQDRSGFWPDAIGAWEWLNSHTIKDNIAYIGRPVPFPLYGSGFKNNVYYVSLNLVEPAQLYYFPESYYVWGKDYESLHKNLEAKGNYRSNADYAVWLNNILKRNTDYLFVYSLHQTKSIIFPLEDSWASQHPDRFSRVFENKTIHIYKILK